MASQGPSQPQRPLRPTILTSPHHFLACLCIRPTVGCLALLFASLFICLVRPAGQGQWPCFFREGPPGQFQTPFPHPPSRLPRLCQCPHFTCGEGCPGLQARHPQVGFLPHPSLLHKLGQVIKRCKLQYLLYKASYWEHWMCWSPERVWPSFCHFLIVSRTQVLAFTLEPSHLTAMATPTPSARYCFSLFFAWESLPSPSRPNSNASAFMTHAGQLLAPPAFLSHPAFLRSKRLI